MLKIKKINDKSMNLDVQGEGCWDDCLEMGPHWELKKDFSTKGCVFFRFSSYGPKKSIWH